MPNHRQKLYSRHGRLRIQEPWLPPPQLVHKVEVPCQKGQTEKIRGCASTPHTATSLIEPGVLLLWEKPPAVLPVAPVQWYRSSHREREAVRTKLGRLAWKDWLYLDQSMPFLRALSKPVEILVKNNFEGACSSLYSYQQVKQQKPEL